MLSPEACMADMRGKTREKTVWRMDWDVANESIRAANWGGQPERPVLRTFSVNNVLSPVFLDNSTTI